jgi:hypothetical protein
LELVEVVFEQLCDEEEVLLVVEVVVEVQDVVRVGVTLTVDVTQELDLIEALVKEVFVVFDDLKAHLGLARDTRDTVRVCVVACESRRESKKHERHEDSSYQPQITRHAPELQGPCS